MEDDDKQLKSQFYNNVYSRERPNSIWGPSLHVLVAGRASRCSPPPDPDRGRVGGLARRLVGER